MDKPSSSGSCYHNSIPSDYSMTHEDTRENIFKDNDAAASEWTTNVIFGSKAIGRTDY